PHVGRDHADRPGKTSQPGEDRLMVRAVARSARQRHDDVGLTSRRLRVPRPGIPGPIGPAERRRAEGEPAQSTIDQVRHGETHGGFVVGIDSRQHVVRDGTAHVHDGPNATPPLPR
ncbi:MAG: hypothetical protein ACK56I_27955, partial [bacterium]